MHFQAYVYIMFVYRVVYVDMSIRSSQLNHLNLESCPWGTAGKACPQHSARSPETPARCPRRDRRPVLVTRTGPVVTGTDTGQRPCP